MHLWKKYALIRKVRLTTRVYGNIKLQYQPEAYIVLKYTNA